MNNYKQLFEDVDNEMDRLSSESSVIGFAARQSKFYQTELKKETHPQSRVAIINSANNWTLWARDMKKLQTAIDLVCKDLQKKIDDYNKKTKEF